MKKTKVFLKKLLRLAADSEISSSLSAEAPDTEKIYNYLKYHQISPLVFKHKEKLVQFYPDLINKLSPLCKNDYRTNLRREMIYSNFIKKINKSAIDQSLDFRLLKGIALGKELYEPSYLRTYNDIDLYIQPDKTEPWIDTLQRLKFDICENLYSNYPIHVIKKHNLALHLMKKSKPNILLDIHSGLTNTMHPFSLPHQDFWNNTSYLKINGGRVKVLEKHYRVVYLLFHIFKHNYFKLSWFLDLYLFIEEKSIDPKKMRVLIKKYNMNKAWNIYSNITRNIFGKKSDITEKFDIKHSSKSSMINEDIIIKGKLSYRHSISRILLTVNYLDNPLLVMKFLYKHLFPPIELLKEFYINKGLKINYLNYFKLRFRKIASLIKHIF